MSKDKSKENVVWVVTKKFWKVISDFLGLFILAFAIWLLFLLGRESGNSTVFSILRNISWPVTLVIFGLVFLVPIYQLSKSLSSKLSSATTVKIGEVEFQTQTLEEIIIEREILRTGIHLASVDEDYSEDEFVYLKSEEEKFPNRLDDLSKSGREQVLQAGIRMVNADKHLQAPEYEALKNLAGKLEIQKDYLDVLIIDAILDSHVKKVQVRVANELEYLNSLLEKKKLSRGLE